MRGMRRRGYPQIRGVGFRRARVPRYRVGMTRRQAVGAIGAITGLALLAACSGQPETPVPTSLPTQSVAPEPSTPPSGTPVLTPFPTDQLPERLSDLVTEPVLPDEASEFTTDGAAAFAQYVTDAANWAYATGDATFLSDVCSPESAFCRGVAEEANLILDEGRTRFGGLTTVEILAVELFSDESDALVSGSVILGSSIDLDANGALLTQGEGASANVTYHVTFIGGAWILNAAGAE